MSDQMEIIACPVCLDPMKKPIYQCKIGHSICNECITANSLDKCPQCREPMTQTRNYQLEQLIEKLKLPCQFAQKGCKTLATTAEKEAHESECKYRRFACEGRLFAKWPCNWFGDYNELEKHFKEKHGSNFEFKMEKDMKICFDEESYDVKIISFFNGSEYFWYKHKVDVKKQKIYWTFQYVGPRKKAANYYYEFEIKRGPVRKFKVSEICEGDVVDAEKIFDEEKCVCLSFKSARNFINERGELTVLYRVKKHVADSNN